MTSYLQRSLEGGMRSLKEAGSEDIFMPLKNKMFLETILVVFRLTLVDRELYGLENQASLQRDRSDSGFSSLVAALFA